MMDSTGTRRNRRRAALMLIVVTVLIATTSGTALAHANLSRSDPPAGASLPTAPDHVQLWFTEALEPGFSEATVLDTSQQRVDQDDSHVDPVDSSSMIVSLKPNLPTGSYAIVWKTQSRIDGHITRGTVPFGVGLDATSAAPSTPAFAAGGSVSGSPLEIALRWLSLISAIALVGTIAFWRTQAAAAAASDGDASPTTVLPSQNMLAVAAWVIFIVSSVAFLVEQASIAADVPLLGALGEPFARTLTGTQFGHIWSLRTGLGLATGALLFSRSRARGRLTTATVDRLALMLGAALLFNISLTSHSAAVGSLTPLGVANDWLHLTAAAVWIGGLLQLSMVLAAYNRSGSSTLRARFLGLLIPRFSRVATTALLVTAVTGVAEYLFHVGTLDSLLNSGYGQGLLVKVLLIVPLVTLAAVNHFLILPVLVRNRASATSSVVAHMRPILATLGWTVRLEVVFVVGVVAVVGMLASISPSRQAGSSVAGPFTQSAAANDLVVTLGVAPGRPGPNRYAVNVRDGNAQSVADLDRVSIRFTYLDREMGTAEAVLSPVNRGRFEGASGDLAVVGRWQASVIVRQTGRPDAASVFAFEVTPEGARTFQNAEWQLTWVFYVGLLLGLAGLAGIVQGILQRSSHRNRARLLAAYGLIGLLFGAWLAVSDLQHAQAAAHAKTLALQYPATQQSIADGASTYRQNCLLCHGPGAQGDGPLAKTLVPPASNLLLHVPLHSEVEISNWIANGLSRTGMPAFRKTLTEQQRWDVLNYITSLLGAPPLVTLAQNAGPTLVTLTVDPVAPGPNTLAATLQDSIGTLVTDAEVRLRAQPSEATEGEEAAIPLTPNNGVYSTSVELASAGRWRFDALVTLPGQAEQVARFDLSLPAPGAAGAEQLLLQVDKTMNQLRSAVEDNRLTSGGPIVVTRYELQAPDRMHYIVQTPDGSSETYILGTVRYDRKGNDPWDSAPFLGTQSYQWPQYSFYPSATQVTIVDQEPVQDIPCVVISFFDPPSGARYRLWVGVDDHRIHQYTMMATGHYMITAFSAFDGPLSLQPPDAGHAP